MPRRSARLSLGLSILLSCASTSRLWPFEVCGLRLKKQEKEPEPEKNEQDPNPPALSALFGEAPTKEGETWRYGEAVTAFAGAMAPFGVRRERRGDCSQDCCTGEGDRKVVKEKFGEIKGSVQLCAVGCLLSGEVCMRDCVKKMGFQDACAECFVDLATCSKNSCTWDCTIGGGPSSKACKKCSQKKCFPKLVRCSGLPEGELPP